MISHLEWRDMAVPSNTGGGPNLRAKGNVPVVGALVGDWARKNDKIGELPGDGRLMRSEFAVGEEGVWISGEEPVELDEPEETETERALRAEVFIMIGSECLTKSVVLRLLLEDILYVMLVVWR